MPLRGYAIAAAFISAVTGICAGQTLRRVNYAVEERSRVQLEIILAGRGNVQAGDASTCISLLDGTKTVCPRGGMTR